MIATSPHPTSQRGTERIDGIEVKVGTPMGVVRWHPDGDQWRPELIEGAFAGIVRDDTTDRRTLRLVIRKRGAEFDEIREIDVDDDWEVCSR